MDNLTLKIKSVFNKFNHENNNNNNNITKKSSVSTIFVNSNEPLLSENELIFEEMDLMIREEINRFEQGLTDYIKSQLGGKINEDVENRYISRITELYERWAYLDISDNQSSTSSHISMNDFEIKEKMKELKKRRKTLEKQTNKRISNWKNISPKKAIVEFEEGILLGNGYNPDTERVLNYTIILVHPR